MKIAGIDNSMSSPAIVIFELDDNYDVINHDYLNLNKVKKQHVENHIFPLPDYENEYQRIVEKNEFLVNELIKRKVEYCAIENYSYASAGLTYNIGENTGYLKICIYKAGMKLKAYDVTSNKMAFTGKGTAKKEQMIEEYIKQGNPLGLPEKIIKSDTPLNDIVDAFSLARLLQIELKLRFGVINIRELPEYVIRVFNTIRKDTKTNILNEDFIIKKEK